MLPSPPRCKMCTSPFGLPFGPPLRVIGKGRWPGNPRYCAGCFRDLYRHREGAEVDCTLFFADVRGSTALAETMRPAEFRALLDRFYAVAAEVLVIPALAGEEHATRGIDAGRALLRATGNHADTPWIPIGIGINSGEAYVGAVGTAEHVEFTALGDVVNTAARLAAEANAGELLLPMETARKAGLAVTGLERRRLELRGKSAPTEVVVVRGT